MKLEDQVKWNDQVRTLEAGRAQIMLIDGSTLNVGARSTLKVIKHEPQTQQTELELTMGKVRADVQKITTPGGKFELHTKSAVIGTIDTSYVAETDGNKTKVCGVSGTTSVQSSDPNVPGTVTLKKDYCTIVIFGQPPGAPFFDPGAVADMVGETTILGGAAGGAAVGTGVLVLVGGGAGAAAGLIVGEAVIGTPGVTFPQFLEAREHSSLSQISIGLFMRCVPYPPRDAFRFWLVPADIIPTLQFILRAIGAFYSHR